MSLPHATYANATTPYFIPNGTTISTINVIASTITTKDLSVAPNAATAFNVDFISNPSTLLVSQGALSSINNTYTILNQDSNLSTIAAGVFTIPSNSKDFNIAHLADGNVVNSIQMKENGDISINPGAGASVIIPSTLSVSSITNVSSINGVVYPPSTPNFLIYNIAGGGIPITAAGNAPAIVATQANSVAGKAYRVTCVYDVGYSGTTAQNMYSELQITGTGVSIFSMETTSFQEIINPAPPGVQVPMSKTSTATFVDADGGGFNIEVIASDAAATFNYNFFIVSVERLN